MLQGRPLGDGVYPVVEVALLQVLVNEKLGILAGDAAEQLDDVLVVDAPQCLHLRVELFVVRISHVAYLLDNHYSAAAILSGTIKARRWTRYNFLDTPLTIMFCSDMLLTTLDFVKSRCVNGVIFQPVTTSFTTYVFSQRRRAAI